MLTGTASSAPRTGRARGLGQVLAALAQALTGHLAAWRAAPPALRPAPPAPDRPVRHRFSRCRLHNNAML